MNYPMEIKQSQSPKILTIDDEIAIRKSFRNYLEDYNFSVIEAENGKEGLQKILTDNTGRPSIWTGIH